MFLVGSEGNIEKKGLIKFYPFLHKLNCCLPRNPFTAQSTSLAYLLSDLPLFPNNNIPFSPRDVGLNRLQMKYRVTSPESKWFDQVLLLYTWLP